MFVPSFPPFPSASRASASASIAPARASKHVSVSPTRPVPPFSSSSSSLRVCTTVGVTPSRRWVNRYHIRPRPSLSRSAKCCHRLSYLVQDEIEDDGALHRRLLRLCRFIVVGVYRLQKVRRVENLVGSTPCDEASAFTPRTASRYRAASTAPRYSSRPLCATSQSHS